ncbi:MAG: hypothetical protein ACE5MI_03425 [Acidimicrobiia bacterium]
MHELGVVRDVLKRASESATIEGGQLVSLRVRIGNLSGVDPGFFRDQLSLLAPDVDLAIEPADDQRVSLVSVKVR